VYPRLHPGLPRHMTPRLRVYLSAALCRVVLVSVAPTVPATPQRPLRVLVAVSVPGNLA
jgi:hypothetical protein